MKIYLAGMESREKQGLVESGLIRNAFYSYYYLRNLETPVSLINGRKHLKSIILDSGAHSFFAEILSKKLSASVHYKKSVTKETPDEYFTNYVIWLKKWMHLVDYYVELDIGELVGQDKVLEWREVLKQHNLYHKCITVYHPAVVSWDAYIASLEDSQSRYIAMESDRVNRKRLPYNKYLKQAYDRKIKVHGFAFLKKQGLLEFPFYSVDGSSWMSGAQYGASLVHSRNKLGNVRFLQKTELLFSLARHIPNVSVAVQNESLSKQSHKRLEIAIRAYNAMEDYYTKLWAAKGITWED